jgi:sulfite reductase (ferredoxin)
MSQYSELRQPGENLRQFFARHSNDEIRGFLAGAVSEAVERDIPVAPVPHGVEG